MPTEIDWSEVLHNVCICIISVCIKNSSIDLHLMEQKVGVDLLGVWKGNFLGRCVSLGSTQGNLCCLSGSAVFPVWSGAGAWPITSVGSPVLFSERAFVVSCGMREDVGQNRMQIIILIKLYRFIDKASQDFFLKLNQFKKLHGNVLVKFLVFVSVFFLFKDYQTHECQSCIF